MVFVSNLLTPLLDLAAIGVVLIAGIVYFRYRPPKGHPGQGLVIVGIALMGMFYAFDLLIMYVMPSLTAQVSASVLQNLHTDYGWLINICGIALVTGGFSLNLIAQNRVAEALEKSEARFQNYTEFASDWYWEMDTDLRFTNISGRYEALTGKSLVDSIGRTRREIYADVLHSGSTEEAAIVEANLQIMEAHKPFRNLEVTWHQADGSMGSYLIHGKPVFADHGVFSGYRGTGTRITGQRQTETELAATNSLLPSTIEGWPGSVTLRDAEGRYVFFSAHGAQLMGKPAEAFIGHTMAEVMGEIDVDTIDEYVKKVIETGEPTLKLEVEPARLPGRHIVYNIVPIQVSAGRPEYILTTGLDISEAKQLEEQVRCSQRMEAVGQLTGGIAHEFNNFLQVINGNLDLMQRELPEDDKMQRRFQAIFRNVTRGADLADRLLSFSRKQPLAPKALMIGTVLSEIQPMLLQTLGETIRVTIEVPTDIWQVRADLGQLENALLNLALNARDAMPDGGVINLVAGNIRLDAEAASSHEEARPGEYVMLGVTDNGSGIKADDIDHAFEPFFTTKDVGKGTGIGLSMVYGFAQQSGGFAEIESQVGHGTTIRLYLPRLPGEVNETAASPEQVNETTMLGSGTILLVEDDEDVRETLAQQLIGLGYAVIQAKDGISAQTILSDGRHVDLLFTDLVMPGGVSGPELAEQSLRLNEGLKVLYTTGYSDGIIADTGQFQDDAIVLRKPYNKAKLASAIAKILS
ncbi:MAG: PAS domain-containing protein [Alphaproteobacteria bacterium]|nr:PAS domain-containing protein [Alphaproteobacteria bacterium]